MREFAGAFAALIVSVLLFPPLVVHAQDAQTSHGSFRWTALAGYGVTHVGMGRTREDVKTADLVLRYSRVLKNNAGDSWYRGRHELFVEAQVSHVARPAAATMAAANFLASWAFTSSERFTPYVFAGGGPVYIDERIRGMGSRLNGNYQSGFGVTRRLATTLGNGYGISLEYRLHHISNAGMKEPNKPLNSSKLLIGITF